MAQYQNDQFLNVDLTLEIWFFCWAKKEKKMKIENPKIMRGAPLNNTAAFIADLKEAVMIYRSDLSDENKKDLDLRISDLIRDLDYL